jgi:hypothetical protein
MFSATIPPSIGKLAGFLSSGFVGAMLGRFARKSSAPRSSAPRSSAPRSSASVVDANGEARHANSLVTPRASDGVPMSPALLRRMRTGRLPLPRQVAELTPDDQPALAAVNAFADRLAELPVLAWLIVGRTLVDNPSIYAQRETPYAILEATLNNRGLAVVAWYVRDAIETSAYYASHSIVKWTSKERRAFAAAHAAAEDAALAILAQEHLSAEDFAALCAPFANLVSSTTAHGERSR